MIFNRLAKTTSFVSHLLFTRTLYQINIPLRSPSLPTQRSSLIQPFTIGCLYNNYGSRRYPKQVGRGPGSGKGKFAGRGMKGQKARSGGGVHVRFQGGQTPLQRRLPKYGQVYQKKGRQILTYVNIKDIDYFVRKGIINKDQKITIKTLHDVGLAKKIKYGVKILGKGSERINYPLHIEVSDASKTVIQAVQAAGGSVELIYRTPLKLNEHIFPQKYPLPLKDPITAAWKLRKLERLSENRGIQVKYTKPQWKLEEQKQMKQLEESEQQKNKTTFVYPVPRVPNPDKIRTRRVKLYKKISYNL